MIDSVDHLQHLAADELVISIDTQHDVVFPAEFVDASCLFLSTYTPSLFRLILSFPFSLLFCSCSWREWN